MLNHGLTLIELANLPDFLAYAIGGIHVNVHTPLTGGVSTVERNKQTNLETTDRTNIVY